MGIEQGSEVVGAAAEELSRSAGRKVNRITALAPSGSVAAEEAANFVVVVSCGNTNQSGGIAGNVKFSIVNKNEG